MLAWIGMIVSVFTGFGALYHANRLCKTWQRSLSLHRQPRRRKASKWTQMLFFNGIWIVFRSSLAILVLPKLSIAEESSRAGSGGSNKNTEGNLLHPSYIFRSTDRTPNGIPHSKDYWDVSKKNCICQDLHHIHNSNADSYIRLVYCNLNYVCSNLSFRNLLHVWSLPVCRMDHGLYLLQWPHRRAPHHHGAQRQQV